MPAKTRPTGSTVETTAAPAIHRERWEGDPDFVRSVDGPSVLIGSGRYWTEPVDDAVVCGLFGELLKASWLWPDPGVPEESAAVKPVDGEAIRRWLAEFGALSLEESEWPLVTVGSPIKETRFTVRFGVPVSKEQEDMAGFLLDRDWALTMHGSEPGPDETKAPPPLRISVRHFAGELALLKAGFELVRASIGEDWVSVAKIADRGLGHSSVGTSDAGKFVRDWLKEAVDDRVRLTSDFDEYFGLERTLTVRPRRAIDSAWIALAATAGLDHPFFGRADGVYQCARETCAKVFMRDPRRMRGKLAFCSIQHSKTFYAARRARELRGDDADDTPGREPAAVSEITTNGTEETI